MKIELITEIVNAPSNREASRKAAAALKNGILQAIIQASIRARKKPPIPNGKGWDGDGIDGACPGQDWDYSKWDP